LLEENCTGEERVLSVAVFVTKHVPLLVYSAGWRGGTAGLPDGIACVPFAARRFEMRVAAAGDPGSSGEVGQGGLYWTVEAEPELGNPSPLAAEGGG
jgi:hypothetical protein